LIAIFFSGQKERLNYYEEQKELINFGFLNNSLSFTSNLNGIAELKKTQ